MGIRMLAGFMFFLVICSVGKCNEKPRDALKLTRVEMDVSGVGRFTYEGDVDSGTEFRLAVPLEDVSDVLRNLIINDPQSAVRHARIVAEPAAGVELIRLPNTRTMGELLHSMRGEPVSLALAEGSPLEGTLVGIERRVSLVEFAESDQVFLTILTAQGVLTVSLNQVKSVLPQRLEMKERIDQALKKEIASREGDEREIEIQFGGTGVRTVTVQFTRSVSQWRPAYSYSKSGIQQRIIFENGTKQDWIDTVVLFTDRSPVLFRTPIYQMAFADRPELALPGRIVSVPSAMQEALDAFSPKPNASPDQLVFDESNGSGFGGAGGVGGGMGGGGMGGGGMGGFAGSGGRGVAGSNASSTKVASEQSGFLNIPQSKWVAVGKDVGAPFAATFSDLSVASMKTHVVTMPSLKVDVESLLVYRQSYHETKPLMSLKVVNRMPFRLPSGPLTVFDDMGNAGEAMLPMLVPHVQQMVNYAIDNEVVVRYEVGSNVRTFEGFEIDNAKHELTVSTKEAQVLTYRVENRSPQIKTLFIEHPKPTSGHELLDHDLFDSETDEYVRYRYQVKSKEASEIKLDSERCFSTVYPFGRIEPKLAQDWLASPSLPNEVKKRIEEIVVLSQQLDVAKKRASDIATAVSLLTSEVERIRAILHTTLSAENRKLYDTKMTECEKRISALEIEAGEVAKQGLALLKELGSTEAPIFQADSSGITNRRRWLNVENDPFGGAP